MKSKKRPSKLPEEWEVIPNTYEGIVTQEEFDIVQQLITSRSHRTREDLCIFAGVIKCVDCGCVSVGNERTQEETPRRYRLCTVFM